MGFEFGTFINNIVTSSYGEVLNNPLWSALIVVLIILIIIYFIFRDHFCSENDDISFWRLLFRAGLYIAAGTIIVFFIHYKNVAYDFEKRYDDKLLSKTVSTAITPTPAATPPPIILPATAPPVAIPQTPVMTYATPVLQPQSQPQIVVQQLPQRI